tara:strand:+ start:2068 stop:2514 length:447 start_codon:yes stop_codon:yes gene_type:complete
MFTIFDNTIDWSCIHTWKSSAYNTMWCLIGCSIGDMGTIYYFQVNEIPWTTLSIMLLAMTNGILTSIILETIILLRQMNLQSAFKTAIGMSLISMVSMEIAMNLVDYLVTGGAKINLMVMPLMLTAGFLTPWPYNYWRLKKYNQGCCG